MDLSGNSHDEPPKPVAEEEPPLAETLRVWAKIGLLSFGGPAGQISIMHHELVERRRWISNDRFAHALNYCMLLPGPEAQQLAIYTGWLLHRTLGGIIAGALFVLPGAFLMLAISGVYVAWGDVPWLAAIFYGLKAAVLAVVAAAMVRIGTKILDKPALWAVAAASFIALFVLNLPFPLVIVSALLLGLCIPKTGSRRATDPALADVSTVEDSPKFRFAALFRTAFTWLFIWTAPVWICLMALGYENVLTRIAIFFGKVALVTFGGAYAVLPYVAQQAVETHGWISAAEMMDGLGLAETTPGPLVLVLQFVGFLAGHGHSAALGPWLTACLAAAITCWMIFVPGYLFIFAGAPLVEQTRDNQRLRAAMTVLTAAVFGVILNLAVWFGINVIRPQPDQWDAVPAVLALAFLYLLVWRKWDVLPVIALGALAGTVAQIVW